MEESWESMAEAVERIARKTGDSHVVEWLLGEFKNCREHLRQCLQLIAEDAGAAPAHPCRNRACGRRTKRIEHRPPGRRRCSRRVRAF